MKKDIAIEEIRQIRRELSAECGHDVTCYLAMLRESSGRYQEQIQRYQELLKKRKATRIPGSVTLPST